MRKLLIISTLLLFAGFACDQTSKTAPVDIEAEKAALNEIMDKLDSAAEERDRTVFVSLLTEDALFCGTDPSEFWNKQEFAELSQQDSDDSASEWEYYSERKLKVAANGNSAIVVTQLMSPWSPKIPLRMVYHFIKTNDTWMILFCNIAFIPKNEDIKKINEAIE